MKIVTLAVAIAMAATAVTANAPIRYNTFIPIGGGNGLNDDVDGVAMIRFNSATGWSRVQLVVNGLEPNKTYAVWVGETHQNRYAIQTRPTGTGQYTGEWVGQVFPENPAILIFVYDGSDDPPAPDDLPEELQRAISYPM
jgi:hypothetical protein